jgi:hypothetical protein
MSAFSKPRNEGHGVVGSNPTRIRGRIESYLVTANRFYMFLATKPQYERNVAKRCLSVRQFVHNPPLRIVLTDFHIMIIRIYTIDCPTSLILVHISPK